MTPLTPREREVCELLCLGKVNKEIATELGISSRTVEDHRAIILRKCDVRNVVELVRVVYGLKEFGPTASPSITPERGLEDAVSNAQS
jgi:DNA-binding NarL/FixJ family response regulator